MPVTQPLVTSSGMTWLEITRCPHSNTHELCTVPLTPGICMFIGPKSHPIHLSNLSRRNLNLRQGFTALNPGHIEFPVNKKYGAGGAAPTVNGQQSTVNDSCVLKSFANDD